MSKNEKVVIIKYNAGNIRSVSFALERLGITPVITDDHELIRNADKVIFPGVGAAGSAMAYLKERGLDTLITSLKQPFLGICLGMQLMCKYSEENDTKCLGIFDLNVRLFNKEWQYGNSYLKVPHMGWNTIGHLKSPLFKNVPENSYCYFVHSFFAELNTDTSIAQTSYGVEYASALHKDNFYGVQFHPEKSAETGAIILKNFLDL